MNLDQCSRLHQMNNPDATLAIGALAKRVGVAIDTIRYYEREGLLPEPQRRASGYRSYGEGAVARLRFIRRAKDLGFTLQEIGELLALSADRQRGVKAVKQRAQHRLAAIEQRIVELQKVRDGLAELVAACPGHGKPEACPILRALSGSEVQA